MMTDDDMTSPDSKAVTAEPVGFVSNQGLINLKNDEGGSIWFEAVDIWVNPLYSEASLLAEREARERAERESELIARALSIAVSEILKFEPGDSRAVSDLAVALAAVSVGLSNDACVRIFDEYDAAKIEHDCLQQEAANAREAGA